MLVLFHNTLESILKNKRTTPSTDKLLYIDALRILACFLVILNHSTIPTVTEYDKYFTVVYNFLSSASSELFLTISGALLLPTRLGMKEFYSKRFSKLIFPVLIWSVVIIFFELLQYKIDYSEGFYKLLLIPIKPVTGVYWFIYVICGLYLLAPIISPWIISSSKKEFQFILLLWLITLILPVLNLLEPTILKAEGDYYFILNYFGGFGGYMLLGVYLRKYPIKFISKNKLFLFCTTLIFLAALPIFFTYMHAISYLKIFWNNLSLSSVFLVVAIFTFFQNFSLPNNLYLILGQIAKYSFGIYLVHILVVRDMVKPFLADFVGLNSVIGIPLITLFSFCLSLFLVKLVSHLPKSKFIVAI